MALARRKVVAKRKVAQRRSAVPGPQEYYVRGCMLLLFHKALYEHHDKPILTDADYDRFERYVEGLEKQEGVRPHPDAPTHKRSCPARKDLPRTVMRWLRMHLADGFVPKLPQHQKVATRRKA